MQRIRTAQKRLEDYCAGELERIEELEEQRMRIDCTDEESEAFSGHFNWFRYASYTTAGLLS